MKPQQLRAQLRSSSGRSSKVIRDRAAIETVVEVDGAGRFVLRVDDGGGYSVRAYPEGGEDTSRDLLAVGVLRADGIVAVRPEAASAANAVHDDDTERSVVGMAGGYEDAWTRYMIAEQRALVARAEGNLARALAKARAEESREVLDRIAQEDERLAKEGLVELRDEAGESYHKHIDELDRWDVADRLRAEITRSEWLARRTNAPSGHRSGLTREVAERTDPDL